MPYTPVGNKSFMSALRRVINVAWGLGDAGSTPQAPIILAGEYITGLNAAQTAPIGIIGLDGQNRPALPVGLSLTEPPIAVTASGAISPRVAANYVITKAGVAAMTLAAPTAGIDDGVMIFISSATAFAHTITTVGLLQTGTVAVNVATFAAFAGAGLQLYAYQGKWIMSSAIGITFS